MAEYYNETLKLLNPELRDFRTEAIANPAKGRVFPLSRVKRYSLFIRYYGQRLCR